MVYTLRFFSLQNAFCFIILTYLVHVLFTLYIQGVLKFKKNNSGAKSLIYGIRATHTYLFTKCTICRQNQIHNKRSFGSLYETCNVTDCPL